MRYWGTDYLPIVWNMTGTAECCSEDECNDTREKKNTTTNMDTTNNNKDTTASIEDTTTTEGGTTSTEDTTIKKDSAMEDTTMNALSKEDTITEASEEACSIDSDCNMVGAICVVKEEEEEGEDRVEKVELTGIDDAVECVGGTTTNCNNGVCNTICSSNNNNNNGRVKRRGMNELKIRKRNLSKQNGGNSKRLCQCGPGYVAKREKDISNRLIACVRKEEKVGENNQMLLPRKP